MTEQWVLIAILNRVLNFFAKIISVITLKGLIEKYITPGNRSKTTKATQTRTTKKNKTPHQNSIS